MEEKLHGAGGKNKNLVVAKYGKNCLEFYDKRPDLLM